MANTWFQFKQFKIEQDKCAMKVSTDACIQGALAASFFKLHFLPKYATLHALDIGSGTGILSLMLAQELSQAKIDAVEIDTSAALQATHNFKQSPWCSRLKVFPQPLAEYASQTELSGLYQIIISNPPFFKNHLPSWEKKRKQARHDISLSKNDLALHTAKMLHPEGVLCVMFPESEWEDWNQISKKHNLYPNLCYLIFPKENSIKPNRLVGFYTLKNQAAADIRCICLRSSNNQYTNEFKQLMSEWYI